MEAVLVEIRFDSQVKIRNCQHFFPITDQECRALA
jgi:hypothetical protein